MMSLVSMEVLDEGLLGFEFLRVPRRLVSLFLLGVVFCVGVGVRVLEGK